MQLADNPGRNESGEGEINYPFCFNSSDKLGYTDGSARIQAGEVNPGRTGVDQTLSLKFNGRQTIFPIAKGQEA